MIFTVLGYLKTYLYAHPPIWFATFNPAFNTWIVVSRGHCALTTGGPKLPQQAYLLSGGFFGSASVQQNNMVLMLFAFNRRNNPLKVPHIILDF